MRNLHRAAAQVAACALAAVLWAPAALGQVFTYPRHAEKSQVRYYDFAWEHVDILVGPEADKHLADETIARPRVPHVEGTPVGEPAPTPGNRAPAQDRQRDGLPPPDLSPRPPDAGLPPPADGGRVLAPDGGLPAGADASIRDMAPIPEGASTDAGPAPIASDPWHRWLTADGGTPDGGPPTGPRTGGVRLFFYERERAVAERAAAIIVNSYRHLVGVFDFVPTQTFPYVLYSSYQEFLQTNLFPLQEGVLGVTSTQGDLKLTLPYFGDHELFSRVSLHEMSHQFTIQKVRFLTEQAKVNGDPLENMPLWFVEGLAEFYALGGIDDEADMLLRDLVTNPDPDLGYALIDFWEDRPFSVLWTYKAGQIRCTFLEETYGAGFIQRVLEESPSLVGTGTFRKASVDFKGLVEKLSGDSPQDVSKKFESWLKRRAFRSYVASKQDVAAVELFPEGFSLASALNASPNGEVVLYRSFEEETGRSRLAITDPRGSQTKVIAADGVPGAESLHPTFGRNFDLTNDSLVYVAESRGRDVLYWQKYKHSATKREPNPALGMPTSRPLSMPGSPPDPLPRKGLQAAGKEYWDVDLSLGDRVEYHVGDRGILGMFHPSFSPDGKRVAFVGLNEKGVRDLYVLEPTGGAGQFKLTQLTHDDYAERQVAWGPKGIVFSSDATSHGHFNLFRVSPEGGPIEQITNEPRDHMDPVVLKDGQTFFSAYDQGRADVYELVGSDVVRRTDIATGLFDLAPGPDGGLWTMFHYRGQRHPAQLKRAQLLSLTSAPQPQPGVPQTFAHTSLVDAKPYRMFSLENWELDPPFGFIGAGAGQIIGQVYASAADRLRSHGLILNAAVYGKFDLTNGVLLYINQAQRITWGGGLFQSLSFRFDTTFPALENAFFTGERFFGAMASARYPFNPFVYVEGDIAAGGMQYFLDPVTRLLLATPELNNPHQDFLGEWNRLNGRTRLHTEVSARLGWDTLRYGSAVGPLGGNSVLLEVSGGVQPLEREAFGNARLDAEQYFPIAGRTVIFVRGGVGTAFGGRLARQFFLSSFDTLRGVHFGDEKFLLGRNFFFSTAELKVPLNSVLRFILLSDVEAIAGVDFGGVSATDPLGLFNRRVLDVVAGVNFALGPLIFRLHFARPINIGADLPVSHEGEWVTNFSMGLLGLPGFSDRVASRRTSPFTGTSPFVH